jgi:transcriptional regulator with XRE-family HTH domain
LLVAKDWQRPQLDIIAKLNHPVRVSTSIAQPVPFGQRILALLEELQPARNQTWLAEQSGLSTAVVSRLISGKRSPKLEHAESMAPVFGLDVAVLLRGTDAESRLQEVIDWVPRAHYEAAISKMIEFESRNRELEEQLRERNDALVLAEKKRNDEASHNRQLGNELEKATTSLQLLIMGTANPVQMISTGLAAPMNQCARMGLWLLTSPVKNGSQSSSGTFTSARKARLPPDSFTL